MAAGGKKGGPWKKGQSGNPYGRPKKSPDRLESEQRARDAMARWFDLYGLEELFRIAMDDDVPIKNRIDVLKFIGEMGIGKAPQSMSLEAPKNEGGLVIRMVRDARPD